MEPAAQSKLLRVIEAGQVRRTGGGRAQRVDVRVLAATHRDLRDDVKSGRFREDLYFRLVVLTLHCPPLRDRREDSAPLAEAFLAAFCSENGFKPKTIDPGLHAALERRRFAGNVRELKNLVERAAILAGDVLTADLLPEDPEPDDDELPPPLPPTVRPPAPAGERSPAPDPDRRPTLHELRERVERGYILEVLESVEWKVSRAAQVLGLERSNLAKRLRKYGIERPRS